MNTLSHASRLVSLAIALSISGCATTRSTSNTTTAAAHEEKARRYEELARAHEALYDPNATERYCKEPSVKRPHDCWVDYRNPTLLHRDRAREAAELAAYHRTAATRLRQAIASPSPPAP